jgi:putative MFS transporter
MTSSGVNAGGRLDRLPISRFHYRTFALIGGGLFIDGFEIFLAGSVLGALVQSGWADLAHSARFISATFVGMLIGAWLAGLAGDRFGRKFAYQINLLIFGLSAFAAAVAPSMDWLIAARFVMGLGLGAEIVVGYVVLSEFVPPQQRGRWGAALATCTNGALFVSTLVSWAVIPLVGWRWMFALCGVGAMLVWFLRRSLPESPRWLESEGRNEEAEAVLSGIEQEIAATKPLPPASYQPTPVRPDVRFTQLFSRALIARTIVGCMVLVGLNAAVYGFIAWIPTFFVKQGINLSSSLGYTMLMTLGSPLGTLAGMWVGERIDRKPSLILLSLAAAVLGLLYPVFINPTAFVAIGFLLVFTVAMMLALAWGLYIPELFPTELRMRGSGICNTAGRLMSIVTPFFVVELFTRFGVTGVVAAIAGLLVLQAIVVAVLGIETRKQPLESLRPEVMQASPDGILDSGKKGLRPSLPNDRG